MAEIVEVPRKVAVACSAYVFPSNLGKYISDSFHVIADFLKEVSPGIARHATAPSVSQGALGMRR